MIKRLIYLNEVFTGLETEGTCATLQTYIIENSPEIDLNRTRPSVLICPGGGYGFVSDREAEPVALKLIGEGYNAFILRYSIAPKKYPQQLLEVSAAVACIRGMGDNWNVDKDKIIVMGFSAGGHLAAHLGVAWQSPFIEETLGIQKGENKPDGLILSYPVISTTECRHVGSFKNLIGSDASEELRALVSLEKQVSHQTPKTFLWHTFEDLVVPVENSLLFADALRKVQVPFEMHIYPEGDHGMSLATEETATITNKKLVDDHVASWFPLAMAWIKKTFK